MYGRRQPRSRAIDAHVAYLRVRLELYPGLTTRASTGRFATNYTIGRSSTASTRPRCSSKPGGVITIPSARTAASATDRRPRKPFHRQCRPPVPLHFTSGQAWRWRQSCTNNQAGPLNGSRSVHKSPPRSLLPTVQLLLLRQPTGRPLALGRRIHLCAKLGHGADCCDFY